MSRLPDRLMLSLALLATPAATVACPVALDVPIEDVATSEVVVIGRVTDYRPDPAYRTPDAMQKLFDLEVEHTLIGAAPKQMKTRRARGPETLPDGRYLIALDRTRHGATAGDLEVRVRGCEPTLMFRTDSREAIAALRVLAGKPPYPADPVPAPVDPNHHVPAPALEEFRWNRPYPKTAWEQMPTPYRLVFGAGLLIIALGVGGSLWLNRHRPD